MTARTAWTAGNGAGLTWATLVNSSDMASLPNGSTVLSSITPIANGTALDMFMDVSLEWLIASSTIAASANAALWLYPLLDNGVTYGDGQFAAGTPAAKAPGFPPVASITFPTGSAVTNLYGGAQGIIIPPGTFLVAVQNNSGFTLTSGTQTLKYRTYNLNLNN